MTPVHLIPFEEASLKLEELPQAVRLAEQLGKAQGGGCCMGVEHTGAGEEIGDLIIFAKHGGAHSNLESKF